MSLPYTGISPDLNTRNAYAEYACETQIRDRPQEKVDQFSPPQFPDVGFLDALLKATYPITFAKCAHFEKLLSPYFALYLAYFCL